MNNRVRKLSKSVAVGVALGVMGILNVAGQTPAQEFPILPSSPFEQSLSAPAATFPADYQAVPQKVPQPAPGGPIQLTSCCDTGCCGSSCCDNGCHSGCQSSCCDRCPSCGNSGGCCCGSGTLFRWGAAPYVYGGPDRYDLLISDRPTFTESAVTVGAGVAQLESGYAYYTLKDNGFEVNQHVAPELNLRLGVWKDWLELRVGWAYNYVDLGSVDIDGADDLQLGMKIALTPQDGILPEMALQPQMLVPTGSDSFTFGEVMPGLKWIYRWQVTDAVSMAGSTGFQRWRDSGTFYDFTQSWIVKMQVADPLQTFVEWYTFMPSGASYLRNEHYFRGGVMLHLTDNIQLDWYSGFGCSSPAWDFFTGVGITVRTY